MVTLTKIISLIIHILDYIFYLFFKRMNFKNIIYDNLRQSYTIKKIDNKDFKFFTPSKASKYRVETILKKEPDTIQFIKNFSKKKEGTFFDIGANVGLYSVYAARINPKLKVFSFEPSGLNLGILNRNLSINNLDKRVYVVPIALRKKNIKFSLLSETFLYEGGSLASIDKPINAYERKFKPATSYNTISASLNYLVDKKIIPIPNYIKIDVDGLELDILSGASMILKSPKLNGILIEVNLKSKKFFKIDKLMKKYGFRKSSDEKLEKNKLIVNVIYKK